MSEQSWANQKEWENERPEPPDFKIIEAKDTCDMCGKETAEVRMIKEKIDICHYCAFKEYGLEAEDLKQ